MSLDDEFGTRQRKKRAFFVPFILSEGTFFKICVLSQCIVYRVHFQNIHIFTYQKALLHTLLLLVFKIVESHQCILNTILFVREVFLRNTTSTLNYLMKMTTVQKQINVNHIFAGCNFISEIPFDFVINCNRVICQ